MSEKEEKNQMEQQELLYRFSMYEKQIEELQKQIEAVEKGVVDLTSLDFGLDELTGSTGKEIYAPFGKGIFVKAKLLSEELNVDIGDGNFVKKDISETKKLIEEQIKKLEEIKIELENNLEELGQEITKMMNDLQSREQEHSNEHEEGHNHSHEHSHGSEHNHKH